MAIVASDNAHAQGALSWNTFRGGSLDDFVDAITVDSYGNSYITGNSEIGTYPFAFVSKIDPRGVKIWDKFLGSSAAYDNGQAVAVDGSGKVYVVGGSGANWGSPARAHSGNGMDAFVAILNSDGNLLWSTFMGTRGNFDFARAVTINADGHLFVAGDSDADWGWAITKKRHSGSRDFFALKMTSTGVVFWHTFMGSSDWDSCRDMARDINGNIYLSGSSSGEWGVPRNGYSGVGDAMVVKLNGNGDYQWHTFLGSGAYDIAQSIATDTTGNVYISGASKSSWGTPLRAYQGQSDGFVAKLNSAGNRLWNTFMGSTGRDEALGMTVDGRGNIYVTGWSSASWGNPQNPFNDANDAFVAQLNPSGVRRWHTFLGGTGNDGADDITSNGAGNIVIAGSSAATWGAPVTAHRGDWDVFAAKLRTGTALPPFLLLLND